MATPEYGYQPPAMPPPPAPPVKVRPGRPWYLVALVLFLAGVAWLVFGFLSLARQVDSFQRVPLPSGGRVSLRSGGYVIYYEGPGAGDARSPVPAFVVQVVPASPGAAVASLRPYTVSLTYGFGSHHGRAVLSLRIARPGTFTVKSPNAPAAAAGQSLAIGPSVAGRIVAILLPGLLLIFAGPVAALGLFVTRMVLISRRRRAAAATWYPPGPA